MTRARECRAGGCTRRTLSAFCWQHKDMAEAVMLEDYIQTLQRLCDTLGGDVEVVGRGQTFDPIGLPALIHVVDTEFGIKSARRFKGDNRRQVLCLS